MPLSPLSKQLIGPNRAARVISHCPESRLQLKLSSMKIDQKMRLRRQFECSDCPFSATFDAVYWTLILTIKRPIPENFIQLLIIFTSYNAIHS